MARRTQKQPVARRPQAKPMTQPSADEPSPTNFDLDPINFRQLPPPPAIINAAADNLVIPPQVCPRPIMATETAFSGSDHGGQDYDLVDSPDSQSAGRAYSSNVTPKNGAQSGPKHTRSYQACNACRARKTRCSRGNPDNPHEGKCTKCKREGKECVFEPTRKRTDKDKAKTDSGAATSSRKRTASDASFDESAFKRNNSDFSPMNSLSPTGITVNTVTTHSNNLFPMSPMLASPGQFTTSMGPPRSVPQPNQMGIPPGFAAARTQNPLRPGNGLTSDEQLQSPFAAEVMSDSVASSQQGMVLLLKAAGEAQGQSPGFNGSPQSESRRSRTLSGALGTTVNDIDWASLSAQQAITYQKAIQTWSRMRYVRAGWFTAEEAMSWIDQFYEYLQPMTPVTIPDFRAPEKHYNLLIEEPVLALTILTIASRQFHLQGHAAISRSHNIHDKLWNALRGMVERLLWGQEQFGGGLCGAGTAPVRESETGQITWKGSLRTLGTIQALLLLTDWQPRALHFPPGDDEGFLVDTFGLEATDHVIKDDAANHASLPFAAALEPAWRSDRMSWMLLGLAQSLSFELGVFSTRHDNCGLDHSEDSECTKKRRLGRLVHTYVSQTSGRLGIKSMISPHNDADETFDKTHVLDDIDLMHLRWLELAKIMYDANVNIFATQKQTRDLTTSGGYKTEIDKLTPRLARWKTAFDRDITKFNPSMGTVLTMEYEYARMFINSLGFNRVLELWRATGPQAQQSLLVKITEENKTYINEVREASNNLVSAVLTGFAQQNQLRNAAVRTYLRAFSGMVFTLKLLSLGNHEREVRKSLNLLVHLASAMKEQFVDDVHISSMIAAQVQALATSVIRSVIRIQKPSGNSNQSSREHSIRRSPSQGQEKINTTMESRATEQAQIYRSPDPLADIEARPMAEFSERSFMPPPPVMELGDDGIDFDPNLDQTMQFDFSNADWLTLPLDNIFGQSDLVVEPGMGGVGPSLGDKDLLEFIAPSDHNMLTTPGQNQNHGQNLNQGHWNGNIHPHHNHNGYSGMNGF